MSKQKTFGSLMRTPTDDLNTILAALDDKMTAYEELVAIKERVDNNTLHSELYNFLNAHGSMENLFRGFPPPSEDGKYSMEDMHGLQMECIDIAIEGLITDIKNALIALLRAFKNWVMDWIDTNRRMHFRLQRHLTRLNNNRMLYGNQAVFNKASGVVYHYKDEWRVMFDAASALTDEIKTVKSDNVGKWLLDHRKKLSENLAEFGYSLTDAGCINNGPKYVPMERTLGASGAGWSIDSLKTVITNTMTHLKTEESNRTEFNAVWKAFDKAIASNATMADKTAMTRLVRVVKVTKECAALVARSVNDVCNIALRFA